MSDIKLFDVTNGQVKEIPGAAVQVEKSLQLLFEANLEVLLGLQFLASEYSTGPAHGGRIDTLGLDEDGSPVIIEYKRAINENVVSQGLYYLDWLLDHRKEFQWLVMEKLGAEAAKNVDWSGPRLLCIAGDFTRYDEHAVKQIARNIELLRYRRFGDLLMLELVHAPKQARVTIQPAGSDKSQVTPSVVSSGVNDPNQSRRIAYRLANADAALRDLYEAVRSYLISMGDDVQVKELQYYIAFKRIKNFAYVDVYPHAKVVIVYLKVDPKTITMEDGFTRDFTGVDHKRGGNLQVTLRTMQDFAKAQPLFARSYEVS